MAYSFPVVVKKSVWENQKTGDIELQPIQDPSLTHVTWTLKLIRTSPDVIQFVLKAIWGKIPIPTLKVRLYYSTVNHGRNYILDQELYNGVFSAWSNKIIESEDLRILIEVREFVYPEITFQV